MSDDDTPEDKEMERLFAPSRRPQINTQEILDDIAHLKQYAKQEAIELEKEKTRQIMKKRATEQQRLTEQYALENAERIRMQMDVMCQNRQLEKEERRSQYLVAALQLRTPELRFLRCFGKALDKNWGGHWYPEHRPHERYERRTATDNLVVLQHSYTDMFFRNLQHVLVYGCVKPYDIRTKLNTVNLSQFSHARKLLTDFLADNDDMFTISSYKLKQSESILFTTFVNSARAIIQLANGNFDEAYTVLDTHYKHIIRKLSL